MSFDGGDGPGAASGASSGSWCERRLHEALPAQLPPWVDPRTADRDDVEFVAACAAGVLDLGDLARLAEIDPATLPDFARVELIQAFERLRAQVEGHQQAALAAVVTATTALGLDGEAARHEVGAALRLSPATAARRTQIADQLTRRAPDALAQLRAGEITYVQAAHLAQTIEPLPDELAAAVCARVLPRAPEQTAAEFRRAVARALLAVDPDGAAQRHDTAVAKRAITRHTQPEAMEAWWITMPAHHAQAAWTALTAHAKTTQAALRAGAGTDPGLDALRVDTLLDAIHQHATAGTPAPTHHGPADPARRARPAEPTEPARRGGSAQPEPEPGRERPGQAPAGPLARCRCGGAATAAVVIDLPTLLGLAEHPGELPGYGPIPATLARELAADRDWERWTTDPDSARLLDRGARRYRPSGRLRRFIAAAHRHCGFPGCSRPAEACDTDHRVTFGHGGTTTTRNLGPLCRTHHNAKTHGLWNLTYDQPTHTWTWTSPLGRTYACGTDPPLPP